VDSILWAIKHQEPGIAEIGLTTLINLIANLGNNKDALSHFFSLYLMQICKDIFVVLTDSMHKSGFKLQAEILKRLILAVECKEVLGPISAECPDNKTYVHGFLVSALSQSFPNMSKASVTKFVDSMFVSFVNWEAFKTAVRDFLITIKEFAEDSELLFSEERLVYLQLIIEIETTRRG
jgi:exportin-1